METLSYTSSTARDPGQCYFESLTCMRLDKARKVVSTFQRTCLSASSPQLQLHNPNPRLIGESLLFLHLQTKSVVRPTATVNGESFRAYNWTGTTSRICLGLGQGRHSCASQICTVLLSRLTDLASLFHCSR